MLVVKKFGGTSVANKERIYNVAELKTQVAEIVHEVMSDNSNRRVTVLSDADLKKVKSPKKQ